MFMQNLFTSESIDFQRDDFPEKIVDAIRLTRAILEANPKEVTKGSLTLPNGNGGTFDLSWEQQKKIVKENRAALIEEVIAKRLGFKKADLIKIVIDDDDPFFNAYVLPPDLNPNNGLINNHYRSVFSGKDLKKFTGQGKVYTGEVDIASATLAMNNIDIPIKITISKALIGFKEYEEIDEYFFDDVEIAAIIMHEVGHHYVMLEYLGLAFGMNHILDQMDKELKSVKSKKMEYKIIKMVKDSLSIPDLDEDSIVDVKDSKIRRSLIISETAKSFNSTTNSAMYDSVTYEAMADQFASRLGLGAALSTGLIKLHKAGGAPEVQHIAVYVILRSFMLLGEIYLGAIFAPVIAIALLFGAKPGPIYDELKDRLERIRREEITKLDKLNLSKDEVKLIIGTIDRLHDEIKTIRSSRSWGEQLFTTIIPTFRKMKDRKKDIRALERLAVNELTVLKHLE